MPKEPRREKRPAGTIGAGVTVLKIAIGELAEAVDAATLSGEHVQKGGIARACCFTLEQGRELKARRCREVVQV
ncbi:RNA-binding protein [Methyloceanibacter sp. wino2]|uniref:RNA-binding protein n=1 Tax=Methyloceanibacter sp. wino2 TaxID=2170729 RepID=UPI000D3E7804|nr:RNA-binding protein [Methyloceanibacter sp. wino2]